MAKLNLSVGRVLLIVLFIALGVSVWRNYDLSKQKKVVEGNYTQATQQVAELESERSRLTSELTEAKKTTEDQAHNIASLQKQLAQAQSELKDSISSMAALQKEHEELQQAHDSALKELASATAERNDLRAKFSDIKQLKLAIRDVRRQVWNQRFAAWRAHREAMRHTDRDLLVSDNRGFLTRDGELTLVSPNRLQVHVLEPQPQ